MRGLTTDIIEVILESQLKVEKAVLKRLKTVINGGVDCYVNIVISEEKIKSIQHQLDDIQYPTEQK